MQSTWWASTVIPLLRAVPNMRSNHVSEAISALTPAHGEYARGAEPSAPALEIFEPRRLLSVNVLTYHNDGTQSGLNPDETVLTPSNVNSADFGKVFSAPVDGQIYAQPVYMSGLSIPGQGTHNVVFVATEHDSVYAFDADTGSLIWHDSFINPSAGVTSVPASKLPPDPPSHPRSVSAARPSSTPTTNTLYVVAYTQEVSGSTTSYVYRLHALDVTTGAEKFGGPVAIQAEDNGTGEGNDGDGHVFFDAYQARPARRLALAQRRRLRRFRVMETTASPITVG